MCSYEMSKEHSVMPPISFGISPKISGNPIMKRSIFFLMIEAPLEH